MSDTRDTRDAIERARVKPDPHYVPEKRTLVVTYAGDPAGRDFAFIDWQLEQFVSRLEFVGDVEMLRGAGD